MGQCRGCVRAVLFGFNFLMWLLGCALLSVGIWIKLDDGAHHYVQRLTDKVEPEFQISYSSVGGDDLKDLLAILLIVFGIILILVTFIGCCGAVRENTIMLAIYAISLFLLMCALIGIGAWAYYKRDDINAKTMKVRETTDSNIERAVDTYYNKDGKSKVFMDNVHHRFQCCGMGKGVDDFDRTRPPKICVEVTKTQTFDCRDPYYTYVVNEIEDFLWDRYTIISWVCFGVAGCVALGIIFTMFFCCMVRRATVITVN